MLTPKGQFKMGPLKRLEAGVCHEENIGTGQRWVEVFADHVRRRFNSRALVRASVNGAPPREIAYVYAIEGGGLVLTFPSGENNSDAHEHNHSEHREHERGLWDGALGTGEAELWISSPEKATFEVSRIDEGILCTGFGFLGLSRTPHLVIPRGTKAPPPRDHHKHGDF